MKKPIWFSGSPMEFAHSRWQNCAISHLGIEMVEAGDDYIKARMPVDERTKQPAGLLHGGVSAVLAETLASCGTHFTLDSSRQHCVGLSIDASHIRSARDGFVYGTASPVHMGRLTQVWQVRITDEQDKLVCVSRVTMAILDNSTL